MTELSIRQAVPLAHAIVDRVARDSEVRVLFIKGPVATAQGLRGHRPSIDVDVWVDPCHRSSLGSALEGWGWADNNPYTSPTVIPRHSVTYRHPAWPCELDLHDRFPGFLAAEQEVFERLWVDRTNVRVCGRYLDVPSRIGHSLILALHSLRDPHNALCRAELEALITVMADDFTEPERQELGILASDLGAAATAAPFLAAVGAPLANGGSTISDAFRAWRLRTDVPDPTAISWVNELRRLPLRRRPTFLWYAAFLTEHEMRIHEPSLAPGRRAVYVARLRRLWRGGRALPIAYRAVRKPRMA